MSASQALPPTSAILLAAGRSTRMTQSSGEPRRADEPRKPFLVLEGRTVIEHAAAAFAELACVREIVLVAHAEDLGRLRALMASSSALKKVRTLIAGGAERSDSVRAGVEASSAQSELIAIHDVARLLVTPGTIESAIALAAQRGAALVATPVTDTIKTSSDGVHAESTLDRNVLWCAQTPQVFRRERFLVLLERARAEKFHPTDDAAIWERYVGAVPLVRTESINLKLTTSEDLTVATAILRARALDRSKGQNR